MKTGIIEAFKNIGTSLALLAALVWPHLFWGPDGVGYWIAGLLAIMVMWVFGFLVREMINGEDDGLPL